MRQTKDELIAGAPFGIVGIDADLQVFGGYDCGYPEASADGERMEWEDRAMPAAERIALADHMIALWTRYRGALR